MASRPRRPPSVQTGNRRDVSCIDPAAGLSTPSGVKPPFVSLSPIVPASLSPDLIARVQRAAALMNAGRFHDAHPLLEAAALAAPGHADIQRLLAAARREGSDLAGAEAALKLALTAAPTHQDAAVDLARLLATQGRHDELLAATAPAASIAKPRALLLGERSRALKALGRLSEALASADRAAGLYPDNAAVLHNLAATAALSG
jgi:tetratricopeptide (TPR) repeat protein